MSEAAGRVHAHTPAPTLPTLTGRQRRHLRSLSNGLTTVIHLGRDGLTDAVTVEIDNALSHHELVKISVGKNGADTARDMAPQLAEATAAHWVQTIGRTVVLYRSGNPPEITLPAETGR